jgi:unsaturated rhamnogalacturonyl hydrolase
VTSVQAPGHEKNNMKKIGTIALLTFMVYTANAQQNSLAQAVATTAMTMWKDSFMLPGDKVPKWRYDQGVILKGIEGIWKATGDKKWFNYIQKSMDYYVQEDGTIKGYRPDEYNIDHVNNGKVLLTLYQVTGKEKYKKAADLLRGQLRTHPRTSEGGFWHKEIYPYQMWLDGLYMGQPFYAEYAKVFGEDTTFNDIARQFILMERHARDPKTGLLYHGWDESRQQQWANKATGLSPNVWGRALGWYGMAMVDALDHFPANHPGRDSIIQILNRFARAVTAVQDKKTGLWYDVPNMPDEPKNYVEASASSMLVYTLAKGVRMGYLPATYLVNAVKGYEGIKKEFIKTTNGQTDLHGTVAVSGLGGKPYRDGSFAYYMSEPVIVNDPKGMGAFIHAANEIERLPDVSKHKGKTVLLDNYFNNEWKKDATGRTVRWHYTWDELANGGFSLLGELYRNQGAATKSLATAPTAQSLKGASVYIIVDPDTEKETEKPNIIRESDAGTIASWVKDGGVLVLMGNDPGNNNLNSLNTLSAKFGIRFNEDFINMVKNDQFEQGAVAVPAGHTIFKTARKLYIKELASIDASGPARPVLTKEGKTIVAVAKYGKGTVFAIGDPWLYNEYVDGRKLPAEFDNFKAAQDLVKWTLTEAKKK